MRSKFSVHVTIEGQPLQGVTVRVTYMEEGKTGDAFLGKTGTQGIALVALPAGNYWLETELLGVSAGAECFHVAKNSSWKATRRVTYEWAEMVPATRHLSGRFVDSQPGHGESALLNMLHRVDVPVPGATIRLQDPLTGKVIDTVSNGDGSFKFDSVPEGIYVLHIDSGIAPGGRDFDSADLQIRLSREATRESLLLKHREAGAGSCGGTDLELENPST